MRIHIRLIVLVGLVLLAPLVAATTMLRRHPHFPKTIEMRLGADAGSPTITVKHITVTFDGKGFAAMKAGETWHLGGASVELSAKTTIGGHAFDAGDYRLLARKVDEKSWELVLDPGGQPFRRELSERVVALKTRFVDGERVSEHLRCDVQPSGHKEAVGLQLEVHFDRYAAFATIETPQE